MGLETLTPGQNPGAYALHALGRQGATPGITFDTEGNLTVAGNVTIGGTLTGGGITAGVTSPYGIVSTVDPYVCNTQFGISSGAAVFNLIALPAGTYTTLGIWLRGAAAGSTGSNRLAIYTEAGTLIDTSGDMTADFQSGVAPTIIESTLSLGSYVHAGGNVYIGALTHFSTPPSIKAIDIGINAPDINSHRPSVFLTGQTSFPASFNVAAANANSAAYFMYVR